MSNAPCKQKNAGQDSLISVVVPVFNVEKYLPRCLEAIEQQTYKNLDIILVDDGSTDQSGVLCDAFAQRDTRVRVIQTKVFGPQEMQDNEPPKVNSSSSRMLMTISM